MSKSLGNLVTIEEFLERHEADVLRMMVLNSSYRSPLTFNHIVLEQSEKALDRLRTALRPVQVGQSPASDDMVERLEQQAAATRQGFEAAMDDDFNTAGALGYLFDLVRVINQAIDANTSENAIVASQKTLSELMEVLGLRLEKSGGDESAQAAPFIDLLVEVRRELRQQKLWALSDLVRDHLAELKVVLEDTKEGTTWRWE